MKKIGIIGGLAWPSTVDYYRYICECSQQYFQKQGQPAPYPTPEIVIESVNISALRNLRGQPQQEDSWKDYEDRLRQAFIRLKSSGADFGLIASNTPHQRLQGICRGLDFEILSIFETTAQAIKNKNLSNALVLGTLVTMQGEGYSQMFKDYEIQSFPRLSDQDGFRLNELIDNDLTQGKYNFSRTLILEMAQKYVQNPSQTAICLACTELPLAFPDHKNSDSFLAEGFHFVNTSIAHAHRAFEKAVLFK